MRIVCVEDYRRLSVIAADIVVELMQAKPDAVLGLATGSTPIGLYRELVRREREGQVDCSHATTFNLDEYLGLPEEHPQSYRHFMEEHLFGRLRRRPRKTYIPPSLPDDLDEACRAYEERIREHGGIDLQILGIGRNGHIGFNEPGSSLGSRTRPVALRPETIADNARFFSSPEEVPRYAITMGIGTILEARQIVLLASGLNKSEAVQQAVEGPITCQCPASALQMHPNVVMILDEEAASRLENLDYYRELEEARSRMAAILEEARRRTVRAS